MATGSQADLLRRIRLLEVGTTGLSGGTGSTALTSSAIEQLATLSATAHTIPYFDDNALGALNQFAPIGRQLLAGNVWNDTKLIGIRTALSNSQQQLVNSLPVNPAKIAIIADSEGEAALTFNQFVADIMARYPSTSPSLLHIQGGFNGGNVLYPWTTTGTAHGGSNARGASGNMVALTSGQTLSTSPVISGEVEYADRIRIHYLPNVGTFHVTIDGVAAIGADTVDTSVTPVNTGANARDVTLNPVGTNTATPYTLTSFGLFSDDLVGSVVSSPTVLPAGTRVVSVSSSSVATVDKQAFASGTPSMTFARPSWTSAKLEKGPHTVVITGASGTVEIDGIFYYQGNYNDQGGVQVHLLSRSGWTTADFLALSGLGAPSTHVASNVNDLQQYLTDEGFHLVIFETGINDGSLAAYTDAMQALMAITKFNSQNTDLLLWVPEPKAGHTFMPGMSAAATKMADAIGAAVADMNTILPSLVDVAGGVIDQPYALTVDGVHYSTAGARIASDVLLGVIDGGVARGAQLYTPFVGETGILATPVSELLGTATGYAVFDSISKTNPELYMGKYGLAYGFMAGDPAGTSFAPDTFWIRSGAAAWTTNNSSIATGTAGITANQFLITSTLTGFNSGGALFVDLTTTGVANLATTAYGSKTASFDAVTLASGATVTMAAGHIGANFTQLRLNPAVTLSSITDISYGINLSGSVTSTLALVAGMHQGFTDATTLQAATGSASIFTGAPISFYANPTIATQDTNAQTLTIYTGFKSGPVLSVFAAGSLTISTLYQYDAQAVTVPTGATVTALSAYHVSAPGVSGTLTTFVGLDIPAITTASTNIGVRNLSSLLQQGGLVLTPTTVTVTTNAGTVPVTASNAKFTNSSAAAMTVTMATSGASDGQVTEVRIFDASAVAKAITWVNTENGYNGAANITVPANSLGSTTIPTYARFMFNSATTKWTCVAV